MGDANLDTVGGRLRWARERAGVSSPDFAAMMGLKPVTYRAYENDQNGYAKHAHRFAEALGVPASWLLDGGVAPSPSPQLPTNPNAVPFRLEGGADIHVRDDVPVYGTALGAPLHFDGEAIEQTDLNTGGTITYLRRPPILNGIPDLYGIFVVGDSMAPRYEEGDPLFVDGKRPPKIGDDVVVYLRSPADDGEREVAVLVKRLLRRTGSYYELEQFTPAVTFRLPVEKVSRIHRVITRAEIFG